MPQRSIEEILAEINKPSAPIITPSGPAPTGAGPAQKRSTFEALMDYLNRPGSALRGGIREGIKGGDVLGGVKEGLGGKYISTEEILEALGEPQGTGRKVASFAGDLLLDPLNLVPVGGVGKKLLAGGKAAATFATDLLPKAAKIAQESNLPALGTTVEAIDKALTNITPYRELRHIAPAQEAAKLRDLKINAARRLATRDVSAELLPLLKGQADPELTMEAAARAVDLGSNITPTGMKPGLPPEVEKFAEAIVKEGQGRQTEEFAAGVLAKTRSNYVPRRYKEMGGIETVTPGKRLGLGEPSFTKAAKYKSFAEAESRGFTPDFNMVSVLAERRAQGKRAIIIKEHFDDLLSNPVFDGTARVKVRYAPSTVPGVKRNVAQVPEGWKQFDSTFLPTQVRKELRDYAFHPAVYNDLKKTLEVVDKKSGAVVQAFDKIQNMWKGLATVVRPAFHARNALSNLYISTAAGMNPLQAPQRYFEAVNVLLGTGDPVLGMAPDVLKGVAEKLGVIGTEFGSVGDITIAGQKSIKQLTQGGIVSHLKTPLETVMKPARAVGGGIEDASRMALWIDTMAKDVAKGVPVTKAAESAALHTNKWLINYANVTDVEKNIRRFIPFYVWQRRIIPLLAETALTKPALLGANKKITEAIERESPQLDTNRPEYVTAQGMFQLPSKSATGDTFYSSLGLPGPDVNVLPTGLIPGMGSTPLDVIQEVLGRMTPAKALVELGVNKAFGTGAPIAPSGDLQELRPASATMVILAKIAESRGLTPPFGMVKKGEQWLAPAGLNYAASQAVPVVEGLGKGLRAPSPTQATESPIPEMPEWMPRWLTNYLLGGVNIDTPKAQQWRLRNQRQEQREDLERQLLRLMQGAQ